MSRRVHGADFEPRGAIVQQLKGLDEHPEFATVIDLVDTTGDLSRYISEITETFAGIYLANPTGLIAFVHAVTAPSALRLLAPYVADADARLAARYAWQACAGYLRLVFDDATSITLRLHTTHRIPRNLD